MWKIIRAPILSFHIENHCEFFLLEFSVPNRPKHIYIYIYMCVCVLVYVSVCV